MEAQETKGRLNEGRLTVTGYSHHHPHTATANDGDTHEKASEGKPTAILV